MRVLGIDCPPRTEFLNCFRSLHANQYKTVDPLYGSKFYYPFFSVLATSGLTFITKQHISVPLLFSIVLSFRILLRRTRIRYKTFHRVFSIFLSLQRHTVLMNYGQCACFGEGKRKSSLPSNGILILTSLLSFAETKKKKKSFHLVAFSLTAVFILESKD